MSMPWVFKCILNIPKSLVSAHDSFSKQAFVYRVIQLSSNFSPPFKRKIQEAWAATT